jgi:hypothetical protein
MAENSLEPPSLLIDFVSLSAAVIILFLSFYVLFKNIFFSIEASVIVLFALVLFIHEGNDVSWIEERFILYLGLANPEYSEGDMWIKTNPDQEEPFDKEAAIGGMESAFPVIPILLTIIISSIIISFELMFIDKFSNQIYGLVFDGIAGFLLVRERFRGVPGVPSINSGVGAQKTAEGIWGFTFLGVGFSLQFLSLLFLT